MFSAIGRAIGFKDASSSKNLVQKYTQDLSEITSQIHELERTLQSRQQLLNSFQSYLTYYGSSIIVCLVAYFYWSQTLMQVRSITWFILSLGLLVGIKLMSYKVDTWLRGRQQRRLSKLRAVHQQKLDKLKQDTNFHETNSIIQRFSSGANQSEDAMTLMDEELKLKYDELNNLKNELHQLQLENGKDAQNEKSKKKNDIWFDKVIGVLAGGNDLSNIPKPVICSNCKRHAGSYRLINKPLQYVCPFCGVTTTDKAESPTIEHSSQESTKTNVKEL
ncbi:hypothetical protein NCAS_0A06290 [Naumovozyma castellii]|uniref:Endoplasmic reticulum junction formation protein lunapark n=1 Tax=Naumovozyma castellii TaxID=27288 RepID=G0V6U1_NAUCA|nr:hypothetical protein NCAS_0A06290 [Naumovozyma castellii CBS 4309]CCC67187.1 hypothetical protein NCAS_0A06290 [Naumovozyma castellii CBS 4309]